MKIFTRQSWPCLIGTAATGILIAFAEVVRGPAPEVVTLDPFDFEPDNTQAQVLAELQKQTALLTRIVSFQESVMAAGDDVPANVAGQLVDVPGTAVESEDKAVMRQILVRIISEMPGAMGTGDTFEGMAVEAAKAFKAGMKEFDGIACVTADAIAPNS